MPRFHFHQHGGSEHPDEDGAELPDLATAKDIALRSLLEMVREHERAFWASGSWRMTVTDDLGSRLLCLELTATEAGPTPPDAWAEGAADLG